MTTTNEQATIDVSALMGITIEDDAIVVNDEEVLKMFYQATVQRLTMQADMAEKLRKEAELKATAVFVEPETPLIYVPHGTLPYG